MRQALNNLQATYSGFRFVNQENVFKVNKNLPEMSTTRYPSITSFHWFVSFSQLVFQVCDQPHPLHVKNMIRNVIEGRFDDACVGLKQLYDLGYSPTDIITTLFRVIKNYDMEEYLKLEFMKVAFSLIQIDLVLELLLFELSLSLTLKLEFIKTSYSYGIDHVPGFLAF